MKYNHEIHKRRSVRLKGYDYSRAGLYFITICVQNKKCLFGKIENVGTCQGMSLHDIGQIAHQYWLDIPNHCPRMVLHEHIIMPNHMHGIIQLTDAVAGTTPWRVPTKWDDPTINEYQSIWQTCIRFGFHDYQPIQIIGETVV